MMKVILHSEQIWQKQDPKCMIPFQIQRVKDFMNDEIGDTFHTIIMSCVTNTLIFFVIFTAGQPMPDKEEHKNVTLKSLI